MKYRKEEDRKEPKKISFRDKTKGWENYCVRFDYEDSQYLMDYKKDKYMHVFLWNTCLRESCYNCKFKKIDRESDITLGDYWGIKNINTNFYDNKGTSFCMINSLKGERLFNKIKEDIFYDETDIKNVIKYNPAIIKSANKDKKRRLFFRNLQKYEFDIIEKKYSSHYSNSIFKKMKNKIKGW